MPQIPYSPLPEVRNTDQSGQQFNLNVSPQMFGMGVGVAMGELGGKVEGLGQVAAQNAVAYQERQNQVEANNLTIEGMVKLGEETNKLQSLSGDAATKYLPEYQKNVQRIFGEIAGKASNSASALIVQQEMRRQVGYNIINGSRYAAGQQKQAMVAGSESKTQLAMDAAAKTQTEEALKDAEDAAEAQARQKGLTDPASIETARLGARDGVIGDIVAASARTDPFKAQKMLEESKGKISQNKYAQLNTTVTNAVNTIGAKRTADQITSGGVPKGSVIDNIAGGESGGNYNKIYGGETVPELTNMTVREVLDYQKNMIRSGKYTNPDSGKPTSAVGKYQIVSTTLKTLVDSGAISLDDKFDANTQDRAATALYNRRIDEGGGDIGKTMTALENEWEILKKDPALRAKVEAQVRAGGMGKAYLQPLDSNSSEADLETALRAGRQRAANLQPGNQEFADNLDAAIKHKFDQAKAVQNLQNQEASRAVTLKLIGGPNLDQPKPTSVTEFLQDPDVQKWWDKLTPAQKDAVQTRIERNGTGQDVVYDKQARQLFAQIHGAALSGDEEQVNKFLNTNVWELKLPLPQMSQLAELQNKQKALIQKAYEFPVTRAEKMLDSDGTFKNLGMPEKNSPERNVFRSQLQIELSDWQNDHPGKKPTYDEVKAMAARLLAPVGNTWSKDWWGFGSHPAYKDRPEIPAEEMAILMPSLRKTLGRAPTRIEIHDWYQTNKDKIKKQISPAEAPAPEEY